LQAYAEINYCKNKLIEDERSFASNYFNGVASNYFNGVASNYFNGVASNYFNGVASNYCKIIYSAAAIAA